MEGIEEEDSGEQEVLGSSLTMEKVAAAKQFIENHYRAQMKNIQERKERYCLYLSLEKKVLVFCNVCDLCLVAEKFRKEEDWIFEC